MISRTQIEKPQPEQLILPGLDSPALYTNRRRTARTEALLARFAAAPRTESAFYLEFNKLDYNDIAYLCEIFEVDERWALFRRLCRNYQVREA